MGLFVIENQKALPNAETLLISPFKDIWEADSSPKKEIAIDQFTFIDFLCSFSRDNPFFTYTDLEEREEALLSFFKRDVRKESPALIGQAVEMYQQQIDALPSMVFYKSSLAAARKLAVFFDTFSMDSVNPRTGNPLYKPAEITRALKETSDIIRTLQAMHQQVMQEMTDAGKGKGGREINFFEK